MQMQTVEYVWESATAGWIAFCAMVAAIAWAIVYNNRNDRR